MASDLDRNANTETVRRSAEELRRRIEAHCKLLASEHRKGGEQDLEKKPNLPRAWDCPSSQELRRAIVEAISVLDGTRKCFKSRQLEELRKKLTKALL